MALLLSFATSGIPESFGEGIVIDLELGDFLVLIGGDGDKLRLLEHVSTKRAPGKLQDVVGANDVETRLVLVHRIQDGLLETRERDRKRERERKRGGKGEGVKRL